MFGNWLIPFSIDLVMDQKLKPIKINVEGVDVSNLQSIDNKRVVSKEYIPSLIGLCKWFAISLILLVRVVQMHVEVCRWTRLKIKTQAET